MEKKRITAAEKKVRGYLEIFSLISNIVPSITLDMNGTGTIESRDKIGKSRVSRALTVRYLRKPSQEQKAMVTDNFMIFVRHTQKKSQISIWK